jgi:hypothetical protein
MASPHPFGNFLDNMVDVKPSGRRVKHSRSTKVDTLCAPFVSAREVDKNGRKKLPLWNRFPIDYNNPNSSVCPPGLYLKNTDGRNCCVPEKNKATPQEVLSFVNQTIRAYFQNASGSEGKDAKTYKKHRDAMLYYRHNLLTQNPGLVDDIGFDLDKSLAQDKDIVPPVQTRDEELDEHAFWDERNLDGSRLYTFDNPNHPKSMQEARLKFAAIDRLIMRGNNRVKGFSKTNKITENKSKGGRRLTRKKHYKRRQS